MTDNLLEAMLIAGTISIGASIVRSGILELNTTVAQLEQRVRESQQSLIPSLEEKQIDGKLYMCVPREDYFGR